LSERIVLLSISYHNLGVEEEFLSRFDRALDWYAKAVHLAREQLGPDEEVTRTFQRSLDAARQQVDALHRHHKEQQRAAEAQQARRMQMAASAASLAAGTAVGGRSRPVSAASARSSSAARSSRPSSAAPSRGAYSSAVPAVQSASSGRARHSSGYAQQQQPVHSVSQSDFFRQTSSHAQQPSYASATAGSSSRVRPKSASVSRPPRPR
jgi:hypothetical protein